MTKRTTYDGESGVAHALGWHWTCADRTLGYGDGRVVEPGETLTVDCEPVLCEAGLHASASITDALRYAPGPYVWRVRLGGNVMLGDDKMVGTERTALWGFDASDLLRDYARRCALDVVHLWDAPDVVVRYLRGDSAYRAAARDAAWDAAWAAGRAAAMDAARDAAWDAARDAAWAAARDAAWAAAWAAARDAAWDAAKDRQRRRLTAMVCAEARRRGLA